ncbi:fimbria/pilus outer membrane usher protein [Erwinia sp. S63]|uniref:fimbria/pilus outer membrane usher protein n=1 Tax=Erwinia sp. S63 TaxID=2769341 RepID=UPI00190CF717|nr:fimbria/pilus outer membrane usher protein [Erwinia sp. S63]MBK0095010.1 fimbria/pilus outer membrane usher protein [Erwinia sp. S63]
MAVTRPLLVASLALAAVPPQGKAYTFSPALLEGAAADTDLSVFNQGGQLPGRYKVEVVLNGVRVDYQSLLFTPEQDINGHQTLVPCITRAMLSEYGVMMKGLEVSEKETRTGQFELSQIPGAKSEFLFYEQSLHLSIPQIFMKPGLKDIPPRTLWDEGIPAFLMNYRVVTSQSVMRGPSGRTSQYSWLRLSPGFNLGAWRLRNDTEWHQTKGIPGQWHAINTYLERGLNDINSRLTLGERTTSSVIFDSVPFRGVMLASDDRMVPSSQYMFAPVIRGVARTQARVEVKQNGYTVYNQIVAAGPFALADLNSTGSGGDFQVTVWEADGVPQVFTVPFQTPAVAVKEGYLRYSVMAGQYRSHDKQVIPAPVMESTAIYGLPGGFTLYGGLQASRHYQSPSVGVGLSMGDWGALSADVNFSRGQLSGQEIMRGQSWRMRYSKEIVATNTSFSLVNFQFSQANYLTLSETLDSWRSNNAKNIFHVRRKRKSRTGLYVSQGIGNWGYLHASAFHETYWNSHLHDTSFNAGYSIPFYGMTLSLDWSMNRSGYRHRRNHITSLWLSVPLSKWVGGNTRASYRYTNASSGREIHSAGLNGDAFDQRLQWSVDQRYKPGKEDSASNGDVYLGWIGTYGKFSGGYSYERNYRQRSVALEGGLIAHGHGVTLTQTLGESNALIEARGASGVKVSGTPGIQTDYRGYTAQPYLSPYHENTVSLDPTTFSSEAEINITDKKVIPTAGAVIPIKYETQIGAKAIITLLGPDGHKLPFGSLVRIESSSSTEAVVDNKGRVYLSGLSSKGILTVKAGAQEYKCQYQLGSVNASSGMYFTTAQCK